MAARFPRLRRGPRFRIADDYDWGAASSSYEMTTPVDLHVVDDDHASKPRAPVIERLKQQELESYTLTFSPRIVITLYFAIAFVFMPLGSVIIVGTSKIQVYSSPTYPSENCTRTGGEQLHECSITFMLPKVFPAPSYFYYSLTNFHQNHRKYAKSRSDIMNQGILPEAFLDVEGCPPWLYKNESTGGEDGFDPSELRYPCGLTARSFFNDTFKLCRDENCKEMVKTTDKGIALHTDVAHKFNRGTHPLFEEEKSAASHLPSANKLLDDERFIVWMRLSAFPNFDKLYFIIQEDLYPNTTYAVRINDTYPVEDFAGTKAFKISTTAWFGGGNTFLGTAYLVVGFIAFFVAVTLLIKHLRNPRLPASSDPDIILRELAKLNLEYRKPRTVR